jgi:ribosomal protein S27AE
MDHHVQKVQMINQFWAGGPYSFRSGWDRVVRTKSCNHCSGTGLAPSSDGRTECGFCTSD